MHVMHRNAVDWERIDFFFVCKKWFSEPIIMEKDKCDHMQWFSKKEMPSNMVPYVKNAFSLIEQKQRYSEFGWS